MKTMNKVTIIGRLGNDPEVRHSPSGMTVANFSAATSFKKRDGEEETEWHKITAFGMDADRMINARKGDTVYVDGRLKTEKWQDSSGADRYTTKVIANLVILAVSDSAMGTGRPKQNEPKPNATAGASADFDDNIPF